MPLVAGFKSELAANCPKCKIVQEINVGVTEWGTKIQPAVQSAVQAHPEINVVIPIYDSMSQFVVPALRLTGKTGEGEGRRHSTARRSCWTSFSKAPSTWTSAKASTGSPMRRSTVTLRDALRHEVARRRSTCRSIFSTSPTRQKRASRRSYDNGYGDAYEAGFRKLWKLQ